MDNLKIVTACEDIRAWITVQNAYGIGHARLQQLLMMFGTIRNIVEASPAQLKCIKGVSDKTVYDIKHPDLALVERCLAWLDASRRFFIPCTSRYYPPLLAAIDDAPIALFAAGNINVLSQPQIAIVGSRNPDRYGIEKAMEFAAALARCGIGVTSGLALGIDGAAHRGALNGGGDSIAVLATGLDYIYPTKHKPLAQQITENGCLVTEQTIGCPPKAGLFPRRNRIISGLSLGCLVVQASLRSGSLITARLAAEQGRDVFALPGSINNPLSKGGHQLIRQGAKLVESIDDILIDLKEILIRYIENSNKFTMPENNEIMAVTSDNVDASVVLAQDHSLNPVCVETIGAFGGVERDNRLESFEPSNRPRQSIRKKRTSGHKDHGNITGAQPVQINCDRYQQMLLNCLQHEPSTIDTLVDSCELSTNIVSSVLQELELQGLVSLHGGLYSRVQR